MGEASGPLTRRPACKVLPPPGGIEGKADQDKAGDKEGRQRYPQLLFSPSYRGEADDVGPDAGHLEAPFHPGPRAHPHSHRLDVSPVAGTVLKSQLVHDAKIPPALPPVNEILDVQTAFRPSPLPDLEQPPALDLALQGAVQKEFARKTEGTLQADGRPDK